MSTVSSQPDIDFWEFVSCAKCHLPYASDFGKSVPFWLTECGHIICNHHLNPDQSCPSCGATRIQLAPLQQDLDAPMSDWFRSVPLALDSIAYAAKFQQEAMGRQIRFYRARHQQLRGVLEKLRSEISELKKSNDALLQENEQLKQQFGHQQPTFSSSAMQEPSARLNNNGKRPFGMPNSYDHPSRRPRTDSSPHNVTSTASVPNRLTLPIDQHAPELTRTGEEYSPQALKHHYPSGSSRNVQGLVSKNIEQFAYVPPETPRTALPGFSHMQMAPKLVKVSQNVAQPGSSTNTGHPPARLNVMGPPPVPESKAQSTRFNMSGIPSTSSGKRKFIPANQRFVPPSTPMQTTNNLIGPHSRRFFSKTPAHRTGNK